jgi:FkbH-like protein
MPYSKKMISLLADRFVRFVSFLNNEEKKVIILDCDNTLWGGVLGEDGIENIKCDMNADGILFYSFQNFLKERKNDGFLLCLCSKNNEEDVKNAFEKKNMPLKWPDFILKKVSWEQKSTSIKEIASELNLGESSFIFVDDNPNEIEMVKKFTSVGSTFLFSDSFEDFIKLTEDFAFRRKKILQADREKSKQYELETLRNTEKIKFGSIDDYIESLNINMDIRLNDFDDFDRLSQLTEKTNQFNFNKTPYTKNELIEWTSNGNDIYSIKVADKFGDYGTVGLIMIKRLQDMVVVENFLLSCRVLGKKIENKFLNHVIDCYKTKGLNLKEILVKETEKNVPARTFIKNENFEKFVKIV